MNEKEICTAIEALDNLSSWNAEVLCRAVRAKTGYSNWTHITQKLNRERLNIDKEERGARRRYRPAEYKKLYRRQHGICPICESEMAQPTNWPGNLAMDHLDVNSQDWDSEGNRQVTHSKCNQEKSSKSLNQMSKETGKTVADMLPRTEDDKRPEESM